MLSIHFYIFYIITFWKLLPRNFSKTKYLILIVTSFKVKRRIYFFHVLQCGWRHVRVPSELGWPWWCQPRSQWSVPRPGIPGISSNFHVWMPPLKRVRYGHVQQAVGRVLRQHRLQYRRTLLFAPANTAAPSVLYTLNRKTIISKPLAKQQYVQYNSVGQTHDLHMIIKSDLQYECHYIGISKVVQ